MLADPTAAFTKVPLSCQTMGWEGHFPFMAEGCMGDGKGGGWLGWASLDWEEVRCAEGGVYCKWLVYSTSLLLCAVVGMLKNSKRFLHTFPSLILSLACSRIWSTVWLGA